jgi:1-acyl-sn-glycerol-3-phosphate acyltransferase
MSLMPISPGACGWARGESYRLNVQERQAPLRPHSCHMALRCCAGGCRCQQCLTCATSLAVGGGGVGNRLGLWYRVVATGLCFAVFGAAGVALGAIIAPALSVMPRRWRRPVARWVVRTFFRFFIGFMATVRVLTYDFSGEAALQAPGILVVANHPTLIDVIFLISRMPDATCVVRAGLKRNLFTRGPVAAAGYIAADEGPALVDACVAALAAGERLVIFPEGTRSKRGQPLALRRGASHIALRHGHGLVPADIRCTPLTLGKGEPWYRVPVTRPHFHIQVDAEMPVSDFADARALTAHLTNRWAALWH